MEHVTGFGLHRLSHRFGTRDMRNTHSTRSLPTRTNASTRLLTVFLLEMIGKSPVRMRGKARKNLPTRSHSHSILGAVSSSAGLAWLAIGASLLSAVSLRAEDRLEYNRDVRPILADKCFACHGPDSASRKADLRLDQRDAAVTAGALVPGKPDRQC
jgi:hypothetical protein